MAFKSGKRFQSGLLLGLLIITVGVILLLEKLSPEMDIDLGTYWPVLLIVLGLGKIVQYSDFRNLLNGGIRVLVGALFMLYRLGIFMIKEFWPIILIVVGVLFVICSFWKPSGLCGARHHKIRAHIHTSGSGSQDTLLGNQKGKIDNDRIDMNAVLGGGQYQVTSKQFNGGEVNCVLGGIEIDFRDAEIKDNSAHLEVSCVMGSVELFFPSHWEVEINGTPLLGSIENRTSSSKGSGKKIVISASSVMGSVEVRN